MLSSVWVAATGRTGRARGSLRRRGGGWTVASTVPFSARVTWGGACRGGVLPLPFSWAFWLWLCWSFRAVGARIVLVGYWVSGLWAVRGWSAVSSVIWRTLVRYLSALWALVLRVSLCCLAECREAWYHQLASALGVQAIVHQVLSKGLLGKASDTSGRWSCQSPPRYEWPYAFRSGYQFSSDPSHTSKRVITAGCAYNRFFYHWQTAAWFNTGCKLPCSS